MNVFNYFSRPYTVACVDDDRNFLELLAMALPSSLSVQYFSKTRTFIERIQHSTLLAQRDFALFNKALNSTTEAEHTIIRLLHYWHNNPQRWSICELGILDYAMPRLNGLEVLGMLPEWPGKRMLLTGVADERVAVEAFNQMLIHRYIPKHTEDVIDKFCAAVREISPQFHMPYQQLVRTQLNDAQISLLKSESASKALRHFADMHWIEYVVLDNPFGVLGLSSTGGLSWLQLERSCDIEDLKIIAALEPWSTDVLAAIEQGNVLSNSLLRQALGNTIEPSVAPTQAFGDNGLIGAVFEFEMPLGLKAVGQQVCFNDWFVVNTSTSICD